MTEVQLKVFVALIFRLVAWVGGGIAFGMWQHSVWAGIFGGLLLYSVEREMQ